MPLVTRHSDYTLVVTENGSRWTGDQPPFVVHFCLRQRRRASAAASRRRRGMRIVGEYFFEFEDMEMFRRGCPSGLIAVRDMLSVLEFVEETGPSLWGQELSSALDDAVALAQTRRRWWRHCYVADCYFEVFSSPQEIAAMGENEGVEEWLVVRGTLRDLGLGLELEDEEDHGSCLEVVNAFYNDDLGRATGETACAICWEDFSTGDALSNLRCSHFFHSYCLARWARPTCPLCRYEFGVSDVAMDIHSIFGWVGTSACHEKRRKWCNDVLRIYWRKEIFLFAVGFFKAKMDFSLLLQYKSD